MNKNTKALRQENNQLACQLQPEAKGLLADIALYLHTTALTRHQQEQVRRDITHMLLDGASRGLSATEILGGDYHSFCDEVVAAMPPPSPQARRLNLLSIALSELAALGIFFLVFRALELGSIVYHHPHSQLFYAVTGNTLIVAGILFFGGLAVLEATRKKSLSQHSALTCALLAGLFLLVGSTFSQYLEEPIFYIHLVMVVVSTAALFLASWVVAQKAG